MLILTPEELEEKKKRGELVDVKPSALDVKQVFESIQDGEKGASGEIIVVSPENKALEITSEEKHEVTLAKTEEEMTLVKDIKPKEIEVVPQENKLPSAEPKSIAVSEVEQDLKLAKSQNVRFFRDELAKDLEVDIPVDSAVEAEIIPVEIKKDGSAQEVSEPMTEKPVEIKAEAESQQLSAAQPAVEVKREDDKAFKKNVAVEEVKTEEPKASAPKEIKFENVEAKGEPVDPVSPTIQESKPTADGGASEPHGTIDGLNIVKAARTGSELGIKVDQSQSMPTETLTDDSQGVIDRAEEGGGPALMIEGRFTPEEIKAKSTKKVINIILTVVIILVVGAAAYFYGWPFLNDFMKTM